mmetsp:Transcript_65823/g.146964  ORF Transcript_65823/g.146964 Transcript_65823/m.146964 type:complete len:91 (+) Transcript_65823:281-553(+)
MLYCTTALGPAHQGQRRVSNEESADATRSHPWANSVSIHDGMFSQTALAAFTAAAAPSMYRQDNGISAVCELTSESLLCTIDTLAPTVET